MSKFKIKNNMTIYSNIHTFIWRNKYPQSIRSCLFFWLHPVSPGYVLAHIERWWLEIWATKIVRYGQRGEANILKIGGFTVWVPIISSIYICWMWPCFAPISWALFWKVSPNPGFHGVSLFRHLSHSHSPQHQLGAVPVAHREAQLERWWWNGRNSWIELRCGT